MNRIVTALLALAGLLFLGGISSSNTLVVLLSLLAATAMLFVLGVEDRRASLASREDRPVTQGAVPSGDLAASDTIIDLTEPAVPVTELLGRVQGLGPRKVEVLAAAFPSSDALLAASKDQLTGVPGVGPALAERILATLA